MTVGDSLLQKVNNKVYQEAGQEIHIKAGMKLILEAGAQVTLKGPGGFVDIGPTGVTIQGTMVLINSGGAAGVGSGGSPVSPTGPQEALIADNADPGSEAPTYKNQIERMSPIQNKVVNSPTHKPPDSSDDASADDSTEEKKLSWIEIKLMDEDDQPVPGEEYLVTLPDGSTVASGTLDENGFAKVEGIENPGNCKITFPKRDGRSWKKA
jgi:type VI secretion system secreted protein VgrG